METDFNAMFAEIFAAVPTCQSIGDLTNIPITEGLPEDVEFTQRFFGEMLGDPLAYKRSTGAAAELCQKVESDSLGELLVGNITDSAQTVFMPSSKPNRPAPKAAELDFAKSFVSNVLRYAARAGEVAKSEPRRKREIAAIIGRWADRYHFPATVQPELDRVKESCLRFVNQALLET